MRSDQNSSGCLENQSYFNPRSSGEERLAYGCRCANGKDFNPRSSGEERPPVDNIEYILQNFNPRSSGEERPYGLIIAVVLVISIHAPRVRSDEFVFAAIAIEDYFNPRSSGEERLANN